MVAARIIIIMAVTVAVAVTSSAAEESQADCLNRCINKCVDARGGLCTFNCAIGCKWPFTQPTGEVLVTPQDHVDPAATQAAFAIHEDPTLPQGSPAQNN